MSAREWGDAYDDWRDREKDRAIDEKAPAHDRYSFICGNPDCGARYIEAVPHNPNRVPTLRCRGCGSYASSVRKA